MWFIQCCCDVFVNWESWSSTWRRSKGGGGGGEAEQKIPGLKSWVWEKRKRKARKEATVQGYTGRLGWRLRLRHTKRCGTWDCWQSLARKRQHRWSPGMSKGRKSTTSNSLEGFGVEVDLSGRNKFLCNGWKNCCPIDHIPLQRLNFLLFMVL